MASTDARMFPIKGAAYRHYFAIRKNDGTLITTWAGQDSEVAKDGGNFTDCTNEATEIQTSGCGYIDLTLTEMTADCALLKTTVTNTDALPYVVALFPSDSIIAAEVDDTGATTTVFDSSLTEATADHYIGRVILFTSGDLLGQATTIVDYRLDGAKGEFTVKLLTSAPANGDTFEIF